MICIYSVKFLVLILSKLLDDGYGHAIYHDFEDWAGTVVMILQIAVWALFFKASLTMAAKASKPELIIFARQLLVFGSVFILAIPVIVLIANLVVAPYVRHRVVTIGVLAVQLGATAMFARACSTRSSYFKASSLSSSLLPAQGSKYS